MRTIIIILSLVTGIALNAIAQAGGRSKPHPPVITSNQLNMATNQAGINTNLSPTGNTSGTNQPNPAAMQDRAVTENDQSLLITIRQGVQTHLGSVATTLPVHFFINNGIVTIFGSVPTVDANQRILLLVQQTPGVQRVDNRLRTISSAGGSSPFSPAVTGAGAQRDVAVTAQDQALLSAVRFQAGMQLGVNPSPGVEMPVHFNINNGIVGVSGSVASAQAKQSVLGAIQRTPGVVKVVDGLQVNPNTGAVPTSSQLPSNSLPPSFR